MNFTREEEKLTLQLKDIQELETKLTRKIQSEKKLIDDKYKNQFKEIFKKIDVAAETLKVNRIRMLQSFKFDRWKETTANQLPKFSLEQLYFLVWKLQLQKNSYYSITFDINKYRFYPHVGGQQSPLHELCSNKHIDVFTFIESKLSKMKDPRFPYNGHDSEFWLIPEDLQKELIAKSLMGCKLCNNLFHTEEKCPEKTECEICCSRNHVEKYCSYLNAVSQHPELKIILRNHFESDFVV